MMISAIRIPHVAAVLGLTLLPLAAASAAPAPAQEAFWWQDEVRAAAFALSTARTGKVACWPGMTVPAGWGVLPLPPSAQPIRADGTLADGEWAGATRFFVTAFAGWNDGPVCLDFYACRSGPSLCLAVRTSLSLKGLASLDSPARLLSVGQAHVSVDGAGKIVGANGAVSADGFCAEIILPMQGAKIDLALPVELARRHGGKAPPGYHDIGLDRAAPGRQSQRTEGWWITPLQVQLVSANASVDLRPVREGGTLALAARFAADGKASDSVVPVKPGQSGLSTYKWESAPYRLDTFVYASPLADLLAGTRTILHRLPPPAAATMQGELDALAQRARALAPADTAGLRGLYVQARSLRSRAHLALLDAPLLLVKQHPYYAAHIYDTYYCWHPGGGIYVMDKPADPAAATVRPVIDAGTKTTLGGGVYRDPDLHWDAGRLLFAYKGSAPGMTSIYEIALDGTALRRLTDSDKCYDISPCYLPDDRIAFTSTRPKARVPCFNSGVDTLHVMNADGSGLHSISVNNVTEFDPTVLPDGRLLYGRWEYVDKTALYMQSLWTVNPDGTNETAFYANNMAKPTAVLDARPMPGGRTVVASLTPHNGQPVGAIGIIDPECDKNSPEAIENLTPEYPALMDQGLVAGPSEPWPVGERDVLITDNALGGHGTIQLVDRDGNRELVAWDAEISCFSPMLVRPRKRPPVVQAHAEPLGHTNSPGCFLVTDIYQGLGNIPRGTVKHLRVLEETARTSEVPPGGRWWNQAFLVSWQGAYIVKNFLGIVPVEEDGSVYFEAPAGRALYFEALDADGREVQRMRTFVQAAPGVTRSCIGCHEHKQSAPAQQPVRRALASAPRKLQSESWGSGFLDYPTMVQPVLDRHCVTCHGGPGGMAGGVDLTGGWTWAFNISYETLLKRNLVGFMRCNNGDVSSSIVHPPRTIGSGGAPLAALLVSGHKDRIPGLTRGERDLLMAWMDGNSNYYGTWDHTPHAVVNALIGARSTLSAGMKKAGCLTCHDAGHIGNDWVNLAQPELSRLIRAPLARREGGTGLAWCRDRKALRGLPLVDQGQLPPDVFHPRELPRPDRSGQPVVTFASEQDPNYQALLDAIRGVRAMALAQPRVDMPGAEVVPGICRAQAPIPLPRLLPALRATVLSDGAVELAWPRAADTIGLVFEVHRGTSADFAPAPATRVCETTRFAFTDAQADAGRQHYALVLVSGKQASPPVRAAVDVPPLPPPPAPKGVAAASAPGEVVLTWQGGGERVYNVYRSRDGVTFEKVAGCPLRGETHCEAAAPGTTLFFRVAAVDRRRRESEPSAVVSAQAGAESREPVFVASFAADALASASGQGVRGRMLGGARVADKALTLDKAGHVSFPNSPLVEIRDRMSVECWVRLEGGGTMPVILACGAFNRPGWFIQRFSGRWRFYCAGASCDGGKAELKKWTHLVATYDGRTARLYENGSLVGRIDADACAPHGGPLIVGQYSTQADSFQVVGQIAGLKIYHRVLSAADAAQAAKAGR